MKINYKLYVTILTAFLILSCKNTNKDLQYNELTKYPENNFTKVKINSFIDLDTVNTDSVNVDIIIKNVGRKMLKKNL